MFDKSNSNQKHIGLKTMIALAIIALAAPLALSFGAVGCIMSYRGVESLLPKAVTVTVNSVAEAMGNKFEVYNALGREIANEDELVNPELTEKQKQSFLDNKAREYNLSAAIYLDAKGVAYVERTGTNADEVMLAAQALVARLQAFITDHYYTCTKEILAGLGQMYVEDERFAAHLDSHGPGTARLMADAIAVYCK